MVTRPATQFHMNMPGIITKRTRALRPARLGYHPQEHDDHDAQNALYNTK